MSNLITCLKCQLEMENVREFAGQVVACPQCGYLFELPVPGGPSPRPVAQPLTLYVPPKAAKLSIKRESTWLSNSYVIRGDATSVTIDRVDLLWLVQLLEEALRANGPYGKSVLGLHASGHGIGTDRSIAIEIRDSSGWNVNVSLSALEAKEIVQHCNSVLHDGTSKPKPRAAGVPSQSAFVEGLATAVRTMALVESEADRRQLFTQAKQYSLDDWKSALILKVTGVGVLTGLAPGPIGIAIEGLDIAYLLAACGRACYGIGYITRGDVDYEKDIPCILAIWGGAAEGATYATAGKVCIKVGGKLGAAVATVAATKCGAKILAKAMPKVAAKISAKLVGKAAAPWVPIFGSVVSGGINFWIASDLMNAAERYYKSQYVVLDRDDSWLEEDVRDIGEQLQPEDQIDGQLGEF